MKRLFSLIAAVCAIALLSGCLPKVPAVTRVDLNKAEATLVVGETLQLQVHVSPDDAIQDVVWASSYPDIASVSANGLVTALYRGTTTISAMANNGMKATCELTVTPQPFPLQFARTQLDTTLANDKALDYKFKFKCYDPFKVELDTSVNRFDGMAPTVELNPGEGYARIWDERRVGSVATCKFRVYDDISEQIITVTVRRP